MTSGVLLAIIIIGMVVGDIQAHEVELSALIQEQKKKTAKSEAQRFYSSTRWRKERVKCFDLQMRRTGNNYIECEICGCTGMDLDDAGKKIVMSVGHDKARSTHPHLALDQDNLFPQCMPCNLGQGIGERLLTGY